MSKRLWIVIGITVALVIGIALVNGRKDPAVLDVGSGVRPVHSVGKQDSTVKLVEYSDFQCPACAAYFPIVEQVIEKYKDRISFEYRHYPLTTIHRNAFAAARASEAADRQGKFWEMYRLLFSKQSAWEYSGSAQTIFEGYARQVGLDAAKFREDFASAATNNAINVSIVEFNSLGHAKATPTFLLNGKKISPRSLEEFSKLIDEQLPPS
jgi:protein-disulfide isomerase